MNQSSDQQNVEYEDYSNVLEDRTTWPAVLQEPQEVASSMFSPVRGQNEQKFPVKLHCMLSHLEQDGKDYIACWQPHGRCFIVRDQREFAESILPLWFRQSKIESFQRQLNLYGFRRISTGYDRGGYYHELFLRGKVFLAKHIKRCKLKGTGPRKPDSPETEPNFYAMPPLPEDPEAKTSEGLTSVEGVQLSQVAEPAPILPSMFNLQLAEALGQHAPPLIAAVTTLPQAQFYQPSQPLNMQQVSQLVVSRVAGGPISGQEMASMGDIISRLRNQSVANQATSDTRVNDLVSQLLQIGASTQQLPLPQLVQTQLQHQTPLGHHHQQVEVPRQLGSRTANQQLQHAQLDIQLQPHLNQLQQLQQHQQLLFQLQSQQRPHAPYQPNQQPELLQQQNSLATQEASRQYLHQFQQHARQLHHQLHIPALRHAPAQPSSQPPSQQPRQPQLPPSLEQYLASVLSATNSTSSASLTSQPGPGTADGRQFRST